MTLTKAEEIFVFENRKRTESWRNPSLAGFVQGLSQGATHPGFILLYPCACIHSC